MPDLTPGETRFVALLKLKLNTKEMMAVLGISASTIRNYRLRLRRKLELDEEASIEDMMEAM
jgi:DNA-binding CsgD family transcriptional regulator